MAAHGGDAHRQKDIQRNKDTVSVAYTCFFHYTYELWWYNDHPFEDWRLIVCMNRYSCNPSLFVGELQCHVLVGVIKVTCYVFSLITPLIYVQKSCHRDR